MAYDSAYLSILYIYCMLIIFLFVTARIDDRDETLGSQGSQNWWECAPQGRQLVPKRPLCRSRHVKRRFFRHSDQHMEPRQGSTLHYTLPGWRWHSQQGLMLWDGKWFCMAMLERWASMPCFLCFQIKIARFLYEYYDTSYTSLDLPPIPLDRSGISVHCILGPDQVHLYDICIIWKICTICK